MRYKVEINTKQNTQSGKFQPTIIAIVNKETARANLPGLFNTEEKARQFAIDIRKIHVEVPDSLSDKKAAEMVCEYLCQIAEQKLKHLIHSDISK